MDKIKNCQAFFHSLPIHFHPSSKHFNWLQWRSVKVLDQRVPSSKPDSTKDPPCLWARYTLNMTSWVKRHLAGVVKKFGEAVPAQASPTSSDDGSKLRGPPQKTPRVA
ncbi:hypothetical protein AVEN_207310-1, partial [Araneus ventricosus]